MKQILPTGLELAVLAVVAVLCAGIAMCIPAQEGALVLLLFPLLLGSMLFGAWRSGRLAEAQEIKDPVAVVVRSRAKEEA